MFIQENNLVAPVVIVAKEQSCGRGRYDRTFLSPKGGVYMSFVARANQDFSLWALYSAVAVKRALQSVGVESSIKWPNDVKIGGKKVAGILPESVMKGEQRYAVLGIGVNLNSNMTDLADVEAVATSVYAQTSKKTSFTKFVKTLVRELDSLTSKEDKAAVIEEYKAVCETLGKMVTTDDGFVGEGIDVAENGALILKNGEQIKEVSWGEVCYAK